MVLPTMDASQLQKEMPAMLESVSSELRRLGMPVRHPRDAKDLFETQHARAAANLSAAEANALERCAAKAEQHIAHANYKKARSTADQCLVPVLLKPEAYQRDAVIAETVFNVCMFRTRDSLESHQMGQAKGAALECRRLVPDMKLSLTMHPPEVQDVMAAVDRTLLKEGASLRVSSVPDGCAVFVNGRALGFAPFKKTNFAPGLYDVQVDCRAGELSRVYTVSLSNTPTRLHIDVGFEEALQTQPTLGLMYLTPRDHAMHRLSHALRLARALNAPEVFLLTPIGAQQVRIDRLVVAKKTVLASVRLSWNGVQAGFESEVLDQALNALLLGRSLDFTVLPPHAMPPWRAHAGLGSAEYKPHAAFDTKSSASSTDIIVPWSVGAVAVVLYGLAWAGAIAHETSSDPDPSHAFYLSTGALSSGLLWTASWMLLPSSDDGITWWKWAAAGVGLAVTALGALAPIGSSDHPSAYDDMLVFTGVPLLLLPVQDLL